MKNRRFLIYGALLGIVSLFSSCKQEMEDLFEQSASERIEQAIVDLRKTLVAPENGWAMEYYPGGSNQAYGGYMLTVKFGTDGKSVFQSAISENVAKRAVSMYSLKKDVGPTINFDTYNSILHYFSDPDLGSVGEGIGKGLLGDYEFILKQLSDDHIVLEGKKHHSKINMYPLKENATAFLEKVKAVEESYTMIPAVGGLKGTFAGDSVQAQIITQKYFMLTKGEAQTKFSFMFTDKGVKLYSPIELGGKRVESLNWNPKERVFSSEDNQTRLQVEADSLGLLLKDLLGNYTFTFVTDNGVKKSYDVSLTTDNYGRVVMKGLPFDIYLSYNVKKGALEINSQQLKDSPDIRLAIWANPSGSSLSWGNGYGLVTKWNGSKEKMELTFVDNGYEWFSGGKRIYAGSLIIWQVGKGIDMTYGFARMTQMKLTKK